MNVLQKTLCALIVFIAYCKMGYYSPFSLRSAMRAYFAEKQSLGAEILSVTWCGIPLGTLMASEDQGSLPVDKPFPKEMEIIRKTYGGRLGYVGKLGIFPWFWGSCVCRRLFAELVTRWSFDHDIEAVVMIVHPDHADVYEKMGARRLACSEGTDGLKKAPAVLMLLVFGQVKAIKAYRARYIRRMQQPKVMPTKVFA